MWFTIVTSTPNDACIDVHDRLPVLLAPEDWPGWLGRPEQRKRHMRPFPAAEMTMWPLGQAIGNVNMGPEMVELIALPVQVLAACAADDGGAFLALGSFGHAGSISRALRRRK
jgi:hypothetical protein